MYSSYKMNQEKKTTKDVSETAAAESQSKGTKRPNLEKLKGAAPSRRFTRFVDAGKNSHFFKSKTLNELRPYYNGTTLTDRMTEIRKSIYYIRQHWEDFDKFLTSLKQIMMEDEYEFQDETAKEDTDKLLESKRDWMTSEQALVEDTAYEAIKLYTSLEGYSKMYRLSNEIFRKEDSIETTEMIRNVVFLVELINIDLFNYCLKYPNLNNFEGIVYRGMCINDDELQAFRSLGREPISRRNIAVPLGLFSGSSDLEVAKGFIEDGLTDEQESPDGKVKRPLLIKIDVIGLKPEYVAHYTQRFPTSVLSTICAVDVQNLAVYQEEKEVLLRGPFLLILDVYEDENILPGQSCDVLEAVMLNSNRDHISTSHLGDQDALARDMFATMVTITRSEYAVKYCEEKGYSEDAEEYKKILRDSTAKLEGLIKM